MARIPKPTAIQQQTGAFSHDPARGRARQDEPIPAGPLGDAPEYFTPAEGDVWREIAGQVPDGVLTVADRMLVEVTARLMARFRAKPEQRCYECDTPLPTQDVTLKAAELNLIMSNLARMGLTPADRTRLKAPPAPAKKKFANFNVQ